MNLKKATKMIALALIVTLLIPNGILSKAAIEETTEQVYVSENVEPDDLENIAAFSINTSDLMIQPFYLYVSGISPTVSISSGTATCSTTVIMDNSKDFQIYIQLQKSSDGQNFTTIASWAYDYSGIGLHSLIKSTTNHIDSGFYYRNYTTISVKSGTTVLEKIYAPSTVKYYY